MPTPFMADGQLDEASLTKLTNFLIDRGVDGVVVLGVMGEAPKLSEEEQTTVMNVTVKAAAGRVPVFAGSGAAGTDLAIQKSQHALNCGISGLLIAPPPVQNDAVIFEYYRRINDAVDTTIILHDYPAATGISLSPQLVKKLYAELTNVRVIKLEETPSAPKVTALRNLNCDISIVGGLGGMFFLEELERGSDGMMTGFSYPELLVRIYDLFVSGQTNKAAELFYGACPLLRYEFQPGVGLALRKDVYRQRGAIDNAFVRHPGVQIDKHLQHELNQVLEFCKDVMNVNQQSEVSA